MESKESINRFLEAVLGFSKPWYIEEMIQTEEEITIDVRRYSVGIFWFGI